MLLIFGAPCSGKTTFAEKFAKKFGLAYFNLDELKEKHNLTRKTILEILEIISRTNQTLVFEGQIKNEKERLEIRNLLRDVGYEPALIWIQTDVATVRSRLKSKYKSVEKAKDIYNKAINTLEAPEENERPIILSGKHTFETQTKHVICGLAELVEAK